MRRGVFRFPSVGSASLLIAIAAAPPLAMAEAPAAPAQEVDGATKQLMAANGLYDRGLFKLAGAEYTAFLAQNPHHAQATDARYALAVCDYRQGEFAPAVDLLHQVTQDAAFAQRDEALLVLGHCELSAKHYPESITAFDQLLSQFPASKHAELAAITRGQALYLSGKNQESADACRAFVKQYAQSAQRPTALYFLALSQRGLNQNDEAVKTLNQLATDFPDNRYKFDAALLQGQALESLGKPADAIAKYRTMLGDAPEARKADIHYTLGAALYKNANYADAAKEFSAVVEMGSTTTVYAPARLQLGLSQLSAGSTADARKTLAAVAKDDPARAADAKYGVAQCDIADKKFDAAHAQLDELLKLQPPPANASRIALDKAVCLMEQQKFEPAAAELQTWLTQYHDATQLPEANYRRAFCLHKLAKYDQSHAACAEVAKLPASDMTGPAAELDAENLFQLASYVDAGKAFAALSTSSKDEARKLRFDLRVAQSAYFGGDVAHAIQLLTPLAANPHVSQTAELQPALFLLGDALLQQNDNAHAAEALNKFVAVSRSDTSEARFKLGLAQLRANDSAAAGRTWSELAKGPADSTWVQRALLESGQLNYKAGDRKSAGESLNRLIAAHPAPEVAAPAVYLLGWIDFDNKQFPQAADRWQQMGHDYPTHALAADAALQRGVALKEAGRLDDALAALGAYTAAHKDGPGAIRAQQLSASILTTQGKNDQAAKLLAALAADPKTSDSVLYDLAWSQRGGKDTAGAETSYRRLLKDHADSSLATAARTELAELLYADGKFADAAELLTVVVADKTADAKLSAAAGYRLAWCLEKQNQYDKSSTLFADFARLHPNDDLVPSALLQAGIASAEAGSFDRAKPPLAEMVKRFPNHELTPAALLKLGEVQAELQDYDGSSHSYADFLQRFAKSPFAYRAHFGIGWAAENTKHYDEARAAYQKVIATDNGETAARAQFQIGETLLSEGKFDQAVAALLAVEDVYAYPKWSARALLEAGRAFEQLHQTDQAKKQYTTVVGKYKDTPEAKLAQDRLKAM